METNNAYILTKPDGSTALLFDAKRAQGLAAHKQWPLRQISVAEAFAMIRKTLADSLAR